MALPTAPPVGRCHVGPYVLLRNSTELAFNALYASTLTFKRSFGFSRMRLLSRRSSCRRRDSNSVWGETKGTVAVAVHTALVPHAARLRPSEGRIWALVTV